jgi:2-polyprenyl-3-methyl-5-hydroxy-6-metoxy-1,4-benzoquinol methylase
MSKDIDDMLAVNAAQKQYYDVASGSSESLANSPVTNAWRRLRTRALASVKAAGSAKTLMPLHRQWIGDVAGKKVLELGVGGGSPLSDMLARDAADYVALDLSMRRLKHLRQRLKQAGVTTGRFVAADFLSPTAFPDDGFEVIYALSVFHHFAHLDAFLAVVEAKLAPSGIVVTYDPVQIWWPVRLLRMLYRPFQTDAEWEYPFDEAALRTIEARFEVVACQGLLAKAKWAAVISVVAPKLGARLAERWHADDLARCTTPASLRRSLHASYCLRKRAAPV